MRLLTVLLSTTAIFGFMYGVVTLLMPAAYLQTLGLQVSDTAVLQTRYFGAAVLGAGVMLGMARHAQEPATMRALSLGNLLVVTATAIVSFGGLASGLLNAWGWAFVIPELLLAVGYGYVFVQLVRPKAVKTKR